MAQALTKGNLKTTNFNTAPDTRIRFVDPKVFFAQAKIAPITTLIEKLNRKLQLTATKAESTEKDLGTPVTTLATALTDTTGTTVDVAAGTGVMFDKNDIIQIGNEQFLVTARTADALTVVRQFGSEAPTTHLLNAEIVKMSSAYAENAGAGVGVSLNSTMPFNIPQIHRTPIDLSRTEMQCDRYGQPMGAHKTRLKDAMILHMEGKERAFINGQLKDDGAGRRTSRGILRYITTHRENMSGSFTKKKFDSFLKEVMYNGDGNYHLFCSGTMLEALNQEVLTNSNMNINPATKQWGLKITDYASPFGDCKIIYHRILSHILETQYAGCAMLLNMDLLTEFYIQKMIVRPNIQNNDVDGRMDEYLEECCPVLNNEANNGFIYGV